MPVLVGNGRIVQLVASNDAAITLPPATSRVPPTETASVRLLVTVKFPATHLTPSLEMRFVPRLPTATIKPLCSTRLWIGSAYDRVGDQLRPSVETERTGPGSMIPN